VEVLKDSHGRDAEYEEIIIFFSFKGVSLRPLRLCGELFSAGTQLLDLEPGFGI
jgi:hypothetical protein